MAYPWTGAQRALFASDGYDGYATWAAGLEARHTSAVDVFFLPASSEAGECSTLRPFSCPGNPHSPSPLRVGLYPLRT
jgi:hypothetical protein